MHEAEIKQGSRRSAAPDFAENVTVVRTQCTKVETEIESDHCGITPVHSSQLRQIVVNVGAGLKPAPTSLTIGENCKKSSQCGPF